MAGRASMGCTAEESVGVEVLGGLDVVGEGLAVQRLEHPGAEEPDRRAGLGDGDVAEDPHDARTPPVGCRR